MGIFDDMKKFRPMDTFEKMSGYSDAPTGANLMDQYKEAGIDYGPGSQIYEQGSEMMNRDSSMNQGIRANMEQSGADRQVETMRQQERLVAMGGGNMSSGQMAAQGNQAANTNSAAIEGQFQNVMQQQQSGGVGILSGAMANQSQLVQQSMNQDQARRQMKQNATQNMFGMGSKLLTGMGQVAEMGGKMAMGIPPVPVQSGGYLGFNTGGPINQNPEGYEDKPTMDSLPAKNANEMIQEPMSPDFAAIERQEMPEISEGQGLFSRAIQGAGRLSNKFDRNVDFSKPEEGTGLEDYLGEEVGEDGLSRGRSWLGTLGKYAGKGLNLAGKVTGELANPGSWAAEDNLKLKSIEASKYEKKQDGGYQHYQSGGQADYDGNGRIMSSEKGNRGMSFAEAFNIPSRMGGYKN